MDEPEIIALAERLGLGRALRVMSAEVIDAARIAQAECEALTPLSDAAVKPWRPPARP